MDPQPSFLDDTPSDPKDHPLIGDDGLRTDLDPDTARLQKEMEKYQAPKRDHNDALEHYFNQIGEDMFALPTIANAALLIPNGGKSLIVGAGLGATTAALGVELHNTKRAHTLFVLDNWCGSEETRNPESPKYRAANRTEEGQWFEWQRNTQPVAHLVRPLRYRKDAWFSEAVQSLRNERFDFAFISKHSAMPLRETLQFLLPRITPGGTIVGDNAEVLQQEANCSLVEELFPDGFLISRGCWSKRVR